MSPSAGLKETLYGRAKALGIPLTGFCAPGHGAEKKIFREWIRRKRHAGMAWLARNVDLRLGERPFLEGQKTVVICGFPYPAAETSPHIAPYACLADYHHVVRQKLLALAVHVPGRTRMFVDTAPVLERAYAARAGLGFIGKNTMLISPEYGSRLFLGGMFTDIALEADKAGRGGGCGRCRLCLDACPTGALSGKGLDSRKCLSYHTIENHGEISKAVSKMMGVCVFGCGICERVCPKNVGIRRTRGDAWAPTGKIARAGLPELLGMAREGFKRHFGRTPVARAGKRAFIRNVLIGLGNARSNNQIGQKK
jgi:epoxyqueuosine reductase